MQIGRIIFIIHEIRVWEKYGGTRNYKEKNVK